MAVESPGAQLRIGLALTIALSMRSCGVCFHVFPLTGGKVVNAEHARRESVQAMANRFAVPPEFTFGAVLSARVEFVNRLGEEAAMGMALERFGSFAKKRFEGVGQVHQIVSNIASYRYDTRAECLIVLGFLTDQPHLCAEYETLHVGNLGIIHS